MTPKRVLLVCALIFVGIMGFDAYLYMDGLPGNSITQVVRALSGRYPILPWGIGYLMGYLTSHFYDPEAQ